MENKKVVVGMSGGVDSSVAAYLLKEQGYDVIGVTMQIWQEEESNCCGLSAIEDARRVAMNLGIPYYVMNFRREFKENVINYFIDEYLNGRTPNPCIACNRYVKWESLLQRSKEIGADYIATGHYAKIEQLENGRYSLRRAATLAKDQTYALYNLTQDQLKHTLMPVGAYTKDEIRKIAEEIGLEVANTHSRNCSEYCCGCAGDDRNDNRITQQSQQVAVPEQLRILFQRKPIKPGKTFPLVERAHNQHQHGCVEEHKNQNGEDTICLFHTTTLSSPSESVSLFIMPVHTNTRIIRTRLSAAPRLGLLPCLNIRSITSPISISVPPNF